MRGEELDGWKCLALHLVKSGSALRFAGEFIKPGSGFLAFK